MRYSKKIFPAIVLSLLCITTQAQQVPMYSQYIMNGFLINPSLAGHDGYTAINLTVREQWVGLEGAPTTYAASFQTRVLKDSYISKSTSVRRKLVKPTKGGKVGMGGYVFNDNNGIMKRTGFQAAYAYHIPLNSGGEDIKNLSFGLALTAYQFSVNTLGLIYDPNDDVLNSYDRSIFIPDFNFGVSLSASKYYAGFAMTNLSRGSITIADTSGTKRAELGHYFITGGYRIPLSSEWMLEPSTLIKSSDLFFKAIQADLTLRTYFRNDYWLGVSYRTSDAIIVMAGLKVDRFYFGYAFDFILSDIRTQSIGSHEITMAVKFGESARRYRWINAY
jgi:type IX secretion system PorP/SprF family membrane protein